MQCPTWYLPRNTWPMLPCATFLMIVCAVPPTDQTQQTLYTTLEKRRCAGMDSWHSFLLSEGKGPQP